MTRRIAWIKLLKTTIKDLKPILDKAEELNQPPYGNPGFIIVGQIKIPDNVNELDTPELMATLFTGDRAKAVKEFVEQKFQEEMEA